jgi:predicted transcriptional regulator
MANRALLLSIRPKYAEMIFAGLKTVELRRTRPRVNPRDLALVYVSAPVKSLVGAFIVSRVIEASPEELWKNVSEHCGVSKAEFDSYFAGCNLGFGIELSAQWKLERSVSLAQLRTRRKRFHPPQSYHYLSSADWIGLVGADPQEGGRTHRTRGHCEP